MSDIQSLGISGADRYRQVSSPASVPNRTPPERSADSIRSADRVEISQLARELAEQDRGEAPIRQDLVDRVRAEIAAGTYDTPERLNGAIDGLVDDLRLEA